MRNFRSVRKDQRPPNAPTGAFLRLKEALQFYTTSYAERNGLLTRLMIGENLPSGVTPELFYKSKRLSRDSRLESWISICPSNSAVIARRSMSGTTRFIDNSK